MKKLRKDIEDLLERWEKILLDIQGEIKMDPDDSEFLEGLAQNMGDCVHELKELL